MSSPNQKNYTFRFRRFSHKAYAAFSSLHRVVNIGCVDSHITDLQLNKSNEHYQLTEHVFSEIQNTDKAEEQEHIDVLLQPVVSTLIALTLNQSKAAAAPIYILYNIHKAIDFTQIGGFFISTN